eukprot:307752-Amphidinium_carterae.1
MLDMTDYDAYYGPSDGVEEDFEVSASPPGPPKVPQVKRCFAWHARWGPCRTRRVPLLKAERSRQRVPGVRAGTLLSAGQKVQAGAPGLRAGVPESELQRSWAGAPGLRAGAPADQHRQFGGKMPDALVVGAVAYQDYNTKLCQGG